MGEIAIKPSEDRMLGRDEVLHSDDRAWMIQNRMGERYPIHGYLLVANVQADGLDVAFRLTKHGATSWSEHPGVEALVDNPRATSVGDVVIDPERRAHLVE